MADADEDVINTTMPEEDDGEEETPDWTTFASLSTSKTGAIPKRGEKDFESHGTSTQANKLDLSRQALHDALAYQRTHNPKRADIAVYHPETNTAYIDKAYSTLFKSMGKQLSPKDDPLHQIKPNPNRMWFLPEEILYLIERGTVDCRWPPQEGDADGLGLPMSLQAAHAIFIGLSEQHKDGLNFERYSVFSYLKRAGYAVHRAPTWKQALAAFEPETFPPLPRTWDRLGLYAASWRRWWSAPGEYRVAQGPLAKQHIFRSYPDIYRSLALVDWHNPTAQKDRTATPRSQGLQITWHVWKPNNAAYKKSKPGPPDFRIAVMDARSTGLPSLADLDGMIETQPYVPPPADMQLYHKLKHGYKSVILAVVDEGVSSFIRLSDAAFGLEPLFERSTKPTKGKGGGRKPKQAPAAKA
ncbi:tRNA-splicing endonuclease subunit sen54-like protein [Elsinoe fawcettii]|nr:tRNA-splicing endonuclease subunit sen54-like protein [Elsinoe fawcettii]